jgi:hypothetical protein
MPPTVEGVPHLLDFRFGQNAFEGADLAEKGVSGRMLGKQESPSTCNETFQNRFERGVGIYLLTDSVFYVL